jgi:predicted PurR-regulated permease PerM
MTDSQKWLILASAMLCSWLLYLLSPVLMPFVFSAILAYLGDPLADRLERIKIGSWLLGRSFAVTLVFVLMFMLAGGILMILIPTLEAQIALLFSHYPKYAHWLDHVVLPWVAKHTGWEISLSESDKIMNLLKSEWQKVGGRILAILGSVSRSGAVVASWAVNGLFIPVITFYLLRDWDILVAKVSNLLPRRWVPGVTKLAVEVDVILGAFLRGQFYVMLALGTVYSLGLALIGLKFALLIGMGAGLISFVPYLGSMVGIVVACVAALFQFQDVMYLIPVAIVFIVGQSLEGMWLTPWLVGDKIGLHPVAVMFAVLAGGQLFGFMGVLMALPVASVIMVLLRHIHEIYRDSDFYGQN